MEEVQNNFDHLVIKESARKERFAQAYDGNVVEAMQIAGYTGYPQDLQRKGEMFLLEDRVLSIIKSKTVNKTKKLERRTMTKEERQMWWSAIMRNEDPDYIPIKDSMGVEIPQSNISISLRLKASENLGRSEGDFFDRIETNTNVTVQDHIRVSFTDDTPLDVIEAEYYRIKKLSAEAQVKARKELEAPKESEVIEDANFTEVKKPSIQDLI